MADEYEVGFGKPPKKTQFSKGKSGNPAGRPRGAKSIVTIFQEMTQELIHITENGRPRTVSKLEAIVLQLMTKAVSGDMRAIREIRNWNQIFGESADKESVDTPDREKDAEIMRSILARMNKTKITARTAEQPDLPKESDDESPTEE
jgi:hypothetical protein